MRIPRRNGAGKQKGTEDIVVEECGGIVPPTAPPTDGFREWCQHAEDIGESATDREPRHHCHANSMLSEAERIVMVPPAPNGLALSRSNRTRYFSTHHAGAAVRVGWSVGVGRRSS